MRETLERMMLEELNASIAYIEAKEYKAGPKIRRHYTAALSAMREKRTALERLTTEPPTVPEAEKDRAGAALSRVEAERDAVVRDLGYQDGSMCNYCQQDGDCDVTAQAYLKNKGSCFKWRGLRGVGE